MAVSMLKIFYFTDYSWPLQKYSADNEIWYIHRNVWLMALFEAENVASGYYSSTHL